MVDDRMKVLGHLNEDLWSLQSAESCYNWRPKSLRLKRKENSKKVLQNSQLANQLGELVGESAGFFFPNHRNSILQVTRRVTQRVIDSPGDSASHSTSHWLARWLGESPSELPGLIKIQQLRKFYLCPNSATFHHISPTYDFEVFSRGFWCFLTTIWRLLIFV